MDKKKKIGNLILVICLTIIIFVTGNVVLNNKGESESIYISDQPVAGITVLLNNANIN